MTILEIIVAADLDGVRLVDLAMAMEAPKSTIHGLVRGLIATGYVHEERNCYFPGPAISGLLNEGSLGAKLYRAALEELAGEPFNETALFAAIAGDDVIYLDAVESTQLLRYSAPLHLRRPIWPSSVGKAILAFTNPQRAKGILERLLRDETAVQKAQEELAEVHERRVAVSLRQPTEEVVGIASPILNIDGVATRAVALAGPTFRVMPQVDAISVRVREVAEKLSYRRSDHLDRMA